MPGRLPSSAGGFHSPTLSRSRNAGYGSTTTSAPGRRPNQAGIAALARGTAAPAASSIAVRGRDGEAGAPPRPPRSAPPPPAPDHGPPAAAPPPPRAAPAGGP